jgi:uncharacterized protein
MQFSGSPSQSDTNLDERHFCVSIAEWFRDKGVVWSGTPSELAAQLSSAGVIGEGEFLNVAQLVAELEANAEALHAMGLDVTVKSAPGRVRSVSLRMNGAAVRNEAEELESAPVESEHGIEVLPEPAEGEQVEERAGEESRGEAPSEINPVLEDVNIVAGDGASGETVVNETAAGSESAATDESATVHFMPQTERSVLPIGVAVLVGLVALGIVLGIAVDRNGAFASVARGMESRSGVAGPNGDQAEGSGKDNFFTQEMLEGGAAPAKQDPHSKVQNASSGGGSKRAVDAEIVRLTEEATRERLPASQYELGMRYVDGRGVPADKVSAYAWLVIALNNGETRSEAALQTLAPRLSAIETQKIRLTLGDWYVQGRGVPKDMVTAHKWYSLAEVAGSAEGTIRKKRLEAEMTSPEIEQAEEQTTAWLSRH